MHVKDLAAWYEAQISKPSNSKIETRDDLWDSLTPLGTVSARRQHIEEAVSGESFHAPPTSYTLSSCGASSLNDTDPASDPDLSHVMCILPSDPTIISAVTVKAAKTKPSSQQLPTSPSCKRLSLPCDAEKDIHLLDKTVDCKPGRLRRSVKTDDKKRNHDNEIKINNNDDDDDDDNFLSDLVDIALVGDVDDSSLSGSDIEPNDDFDAPLCRPISFATPPLPPTVPTPSPIASKAKSTSDSNVVLPPTRRPPPSRRASPKDQVGARPKSVRVQNTTRPLRLSVDAACRPNSSSAERGKPSRLSVDGSRLRPSRASIDVACRGLRQDGSTARSVNKRSLRLSVDAAACRDLRSTRHDKDGTQHASVDDLWTACMSGSNDCDIRPSALSQDSGTASILRQRGNDINIAPAAFHANRSKSHAPGTNSNSRDSRKETMGYHHLQHNRKTNQKTTSDERRRNNDDKSVPITTPCASLQRLPKAKVLLARRRPFSTDGTPASASPLQRLQSNVRDDQDDNDVTSNGTTPRRLVREYSNPRELFAGHVSMVTSLSSDAIHKKSTSHSNKSSRSKEKEMESVALRRHAARHPSGNADGFPSAARSKERYNRRRGMFATRDIDTSDLDGAMEIPPIGVPACNGLESKQVASVEEGGAVSNAISMKGTETKDNTEELQPRARAADRVARAADRAARAGAMISGTVERVSMAADPWIEFITDGRPVAVRCSKPTDALRRVVRKLFGRKTDPRLLNVTDNE